MNDLLEFFAGGVVDHIGYHNKVKALQRLHARKPQTDVESEFHQGGGVVAKIVYLPVGEVIGAMHRFENMNILVWGDITLATPEGLKRLTVVDKPIVVISPAGTKRAAEVHADCCWITLHASDETEQVEVEKRFVIEDKNETEYLKLIGVP